MKKFLLRLVGLIAILACLPLTSCEDLNYSVEIANTDYGFLEASTTDDIDEITIENTKKPTKLDIDTKFYLVVTFDIIAKGDNSGELLVDTTLQLDNVKVANGDVLSNTSGEKPIREPIQGLDEEKIGLKVTISNKAPKENNKTTEVKVIFVITTLTAGEDYLTVSFSGKDIELSGNSDGFGQRIEISRAELSKPLISFNNGDNMLFWKHIGHADYYVIYVDGVLDKERKYNIDQYVKENDTLFWPIDWVAGIHRIKIQAYSNSANYIESNYSNEITITI